MTKGRKVLKELQAPKAKGKKVSRPKVTIGTMIETPRAAVRADELAEVSDFFSFGTNDLTQLTFGFSRDDVESRKNFITTNARDVRNLDF